MYIYPGTPLDIKKFIVRHTLSAYEFLSLLVWSLGMFVYKMKVQWSLFIPYIDPVRCRKSPMKYKFVIRNCRLLLLGQNFTKVKHGSWRFLRKLCQNYFEGQSFNNRKWYEKKKLNLLLTNPEFFLIYRTFYHLFWFRFLRLLLNLYFQSSQQEISILKRKFLIRPKVLQI